MKRTLKLTGLLTLMAFLLGACVVAWFMLSAPTMNRLVLAQDLIDADSAQGQELLRGATFKTDLAQLSPEFVAQSRRAFCGVASSVAVINAITQPQPRLTQETLFTSEARAVRGPFAVSFIGLTLARLSQLMQVHGVEAQPVHAAQSSEQKFRAVMRTAMSEPQTFVIVNYDRRAIGQEGEGHISPVAAYNEAKDTVLVLDVAAHKYPYTWVPLSKLWRAMHTRDPDSGLTRGYLLLSARGAT